MQQFTDYEHYKNEVKLTIDNTEHLYQQAISIQDMDRMGDEINSLFSNTVTQMRTNGCQDYPLQTDHEVVEVLDWVQSVAADLRREARDAFVSPHKYEGDDCTECDAKNTKPVTMTIEEHLKTLYPNATAIIRDEVPSNDLVHTSIEWSGISYRVREHDGGIVAFCKV